MLGGIGTHPDDVSHMKRTADRLFGDHYVWSVLGAGRNQMPIAAMAAAMGGNVRVGLEDSLWDGPGRWPRATPPRSASAPSSKACRWRSPRPTRRARSCSSRAAATCGSIRILVVATETPMAMFKLGSYRGASPRLLGLTWGAEDIATAVGATTNREDDGTYALTFQLARTLCLLGAKAAGVIAYDTILPNFRDPDALATDVRRARRDGFAGKVAIHPDQVDAINAGFRPTPDEIEHARSIIDAFAGSPGAGTLQVDGKMVDKPHLTQALQLLAAAQQDSHA
jgi:citrate lyase beta subunit